MPQRRERVWGSSCLGEDKDTYPLRMRLTLQRVQSTQRFPLRSILRDDLPEEDEPTGETVQKHFQSIKAACESRRVSLSSATFDTSTSRSRKPEFAIDMLTCIRPSHRIWAFGPKRYVDPQEMLKAHGVFAQELPNPSALQDLTSSQAHDFAGHAFSTSALVAKVLCTMVNANAWRQLAKCTPLSSEGILHECMNQSKKSKRDAPTPGEGCSTSGKKQKTQKRGQKRPTPDEPDEPGNPPLQEKQKKTKQGHNMKGSVLTIGKKMEILKEYEELQKTCKHQEKDCTGFHWGKSRWNMPIYNPCPFFLQFSCMCPVPLISLFKQFLEGLSICVG